MKGAVRIFFPDSPHLLFSVTLVHQVPGTSEVPGTFCCAV